MSNIVDSNGVRKAVLEALEAENLQAKAPSQSGSISPVDVMRRAASKLCSNGEHGPRDQAIKQAILQHFNDLLRAGVVGFGNTKNLTSTISGPNFSDTCFLTNEGLELLNLASRDPLNTQGYLDYLDQQTAIDEVTRSYIDEALNTYRVSCYKATAVLVGAGVENLILLLRDRLQEGLRKRGVTPDARLDSRSIKTVTEEISKTILPELSSAAKLDGDTRKLKEDTESRLLPIAAEFRRLRNDAGHPMSLGPINQADVHSNMLLFPSTAKLIVDLCAWVTKTYV